MKQSLFWFLGIFLLLLLSSCNDPNELGAAFFPDESFEVHITDTTTLALHTLIFDSLATRQTGRLLVGYHDDPIFGKITASSYLQVGMHSGDSYLLSAKTTRYDSLTLLLKYDGYAYYDTTQLQTLRVHRLTEDLEIPTEDTSFYNVSHLKYETQPLGEISFYPRPRRGGTIEIRLSNSLGTTLYDYAINESALLKEQKKFRDFLKGFVLRSDASVNGAILGFTAAAELRLYYHNYAQLPASQGVLTFRMTGDGYTTEPAIYFNQIQSDRQGTPIEKLQVYDEPLSTASSHHMAFIQSGVGIATRLEMPYLRNLVQNNNDFLISKATLEFYPLDFNQEKNTPLPSTLTAIWVNEDNKLISNTSFAAILQNDPTFNRDTHYEMDVTAFVKTQLTIENYNANALLFQLSNDYRRSVDRIAIGDAHATQKMKLKIYLISITSVQKTDSEIRINY